MCQYDPDCRAKGIPDHLHQCERPINQTFDPSESLFYRFKPGEKIKNGKVPKGIFRVKNMSVLRQIYCRSPNDALYDGERGISYPDWGVAELVVGKVESFSYNGDPPKEYTLKVVHDPLQCVYPHSEVRLFERGVRLNEVPDGLATLIRVCLADSCSVAKAPSSIS